MRLPIASASAAGVSLDSANPLLGSAWHLVLNLGRVDDAKHDGVIGVPAHEAWAASGARLPLRLSCRFEHPDQSGAINAPLSGVMSPCGWRGTAMRVSTGAAQQARFVGLHGEEIVAVAGGGASVTSMPHSRSSMQHLRLWLELKGGVRHHDVELPAGSRLLLCANCWDDGELLSASCRAARAVERRLEQLQERAEALKREAASNPWQLPHVLLKAWGMPDEILNTKIELASWRNELPDDGHQGTVQGPGRLAMARTGLVCLERARHQPIPLGGQTVYEAVGTFSFAPEAAV